MEAIPKDFIDNRWKITDRLTKINAKGSPLIATDTQFGYKLLDAMSKNIVKKKVVYPIDIRDKYVFSNGEAEHYYLSISPAGIGSQVKRTDGKTGYGTTKINTYSTNDICKLFRNDKFTKEIEDSSEIPADIKQRLKSIKELVEMLGSTDRVEVQHKINYTLTLPPAHSYRRAYTSEISKMKTTFIRIANYGAYGSCETFIDIDGTILNPSNYAENLYILLLNDNNLISELNSTLDEYEDELNYHLMKLNEIEDKIKEKFPIESTMMLMKGDK